MAALAFKALSYGAEQIPDKFFHKIPGGYFTPPEEKNAGKDRKDRQKNETRQRYRSEDHSSARRSRRDFSPADQSAEEYDYDRGYEQRKQERRRARSAGRSSSRSSSRGRRHKHSSDLDGSHSESQEIMAQPDQRQPYFPPPPTSEYKPYDPQHYGPGQERQQSATPAYGYSPQVNNFSSFRRATLATMPEHSIPADTSRPMLKSRTPSTPSSPLLSKPRFLDNISRPSPLSASFTPSYEPPLAALLQRPLTNPPKPAPSSTRGVDADYIHQDAHRGHSRHTPNGAYNAAPMSDASIPPPPVGSNSPLNPYHHTEFAGYQPSPPPFSRQRSNSQPGYSPTPNPPYPAYAPHVAREDVIQYAPPPVDPYRSHRHRGEHGHRSRARSADSHSRRSHSSKDHGREDSRMAKVRGRFDSMDLREKGLAASVGGAAAGALGARQLATRSRSRSDRRSASRSRSRSHTRPHDREDRNNNKGTGLRARSRSIIDRFRSKSRGAEYREEERRRDERSERSGDDNRRDRRPDRGYDYGRDDEYEDEYDYFSSDDEGNGSPVKTRRHRRRDY
ncbi:hypothetical protein COCMIDRAFT_28191 [Bipolaris oryzae ATCC 44560]|uniref:Uncharacterized protein n=1 Tax=Bipolaris oryzae ATCC 44560 TaxID=930090 RepID=W6YV29_COCMI|nr:uncharacterized protein COCMIDRAFT_28191 [Bipolaris oryzae ATCC 44560]EUC43297.1 hypothetical protein COCMIDRAFT_28191 [Bipolaris oryzae ATCC 44560]